MSRGAPCPVTLGPNAHWGRCPGANSPPNVTCTVWSLLCILGHLAASRFFLRLRRRDFCPQFEIRRKSRTPMFGPQAPIYGELEPIKLDMGSRGHVCICVRRARLGLQQVFSYSIGDIHGLGTFLCVLSCMCIFGTNCDPNWRYYTEKPMAAWTVIFSYNVYMIPYVESKRLGQCTATMAAP